MSDQMACREHTFLFGPVPSRRLGISLGVDLVPYKTCTMDCIYCESGPTTNLTLERQEFFPLSDVLAELGTYLDTEPELDFVTFSGAGEPTLYSEIGSVIRFIKDKYPHYKVALLTNGMLLADQKTFDDVKSVDLIVPSLDAADEATFKKINRPSNDFDFSSLIEALKKFHELSDAQFILEIFIVPGVNNTPEALSGFADAVEYIHPDKVQLNSLDRPGTEAWVPKMTEEEMQKVKQAIQGSVPIEVVGKFIPSVVAKFADSDNKNIDQKILDLIARRPATVDDFTASTGHPEETIRKVINRLIHKGLVVSEKRERGEFFRIKN